MTRRPRAALRRRRGRRIVPGVSVLGVLALVGAIAWHGLGADTPETVKPNTAVQCFGPEASAQTKSLLPAGSSAYLERDDSQGDTDRYGRALAYLWYPGPDGTAHNLERELLAGGYAREYTYNRSAYRYQASFRAEQDTARAAGVGLWGSCT